MDSEQSFSNNEEESKEKVEISEKIPIIDDEENRGDFMEKVTYTLPSQKCDVNKETYKCRFCGLTYVYLNTLKAHERVHDVEEPYVCTKCGDSFRFHSELEYHMMGHQGQKVYKCQCGRGFYRYTDLLYHKHPGEDDEPSPETSSEFKFQHPLKVYAEERKPYICQYCSKAYSTSRDLKFHIYSHRGERAFNVQASRYFMTRADY